MRSTIVSLMNLLEEMLGCCNVEMVGTPCGSCSESLGESLPQGGRSQTRPGLNMSTLPPRSSTTLQFTRY